MRRLLSLLRARRAVRTWHVIDADAPIHAMRSLGFMPARTRREAMTRARECWPGTHLAVWPVRSREVAEVHAEACLLRGAAR